MAEVQLFGDYLNLYEYSTAARMERAEKGQGGDWEHMGRKLDRRGEAEGEEDRIGEATTTAEVRKDKTAGESKVQQSKSYRGC